MSEQPKDKEQLKKEARLKAFEERQRHTDTLYLKDVYSLIDNLIDKAHLSGRDSMRIECVEVARSYKPKLKDKGVEVSDGGIFVDYNEAIASALKKIKL